MATSQTCLDISDLIDVLDLLKKCNFQRTKWQELGLRLGLLKDTLEAIKTEQHGDVYQCLTECLSQWLRRADNVDSRGGANLDSLSDALGSMNETAVAEKLKHQVIINILNNRHTVLSQSLCDSFAIAWLLYAERMLTQEAVSRVVSASPSIPNQREALLTAVKEAVQTDPNSLHTFANVLCTISTNVSLGQTILDDISKYFPTGLVPETIKDHSVVPQDSSDAAIASNSYTHWQNQGYTVHIPVSRGLLESFTSIRMVYGRMFYNVSKIIKRKRSSVKGIKELLSCCSPVLREKVKKCRDISSLLHLIQDECSLTNIALLHSVVVEMKITEAEEHIEAYKTELKEVCSSLFISLCLEKKFSSIPHLQCQTVTLVFDWEPEEHLLKDIKELLAKVSGKLLVIKYIESGNSISVTCSFPFSDVGFTVLRMIENIHILMGQGLKKLTIGNLTLWRRQDVRQKELKENGQDLLQHTEIISFILLEEAEYKLRDAISSKEKEAIELKQELSSMAQVPWEKPLYEELTVLRSQFNEIQEENKELSDKLSKMKIEYLRSLTSNTGSAASKWRRGLSFEIDDCKFHLKAMTSPDYQPLVDNKRIIEKLQERITLMNVELVTERKHTQKIIKDIKDHIEEKRQREMKQYKLYCNHPVTGELMELTLKVHKDEILPSVLDKAYELMQLAPHIPIERCRLVKYDFIEKVMNRSFDLVEFQHQTIEQLVGVTGYYGLFLETCENNKTFKKYNDGGINLEVSVVDLSTGEVGQDELVRGELGWTVGELKQHIGELFNINSSCMRLVGEEYRGITPANDISDDEISLGILQASKNEDRQLTQFYVSSDPEDYQKDYKDSLMYQFISFHLNWTLLNITIPPQLEATPTTANLSEGGIIMKIISIKEENKGKERKIQVQVDKRITLAELKDKLVPLIGVPSTGFRVCEITSYGEYEIERLDETFDYEFGLKLIVRLGRGLQEGECRIELYLLQINNTDFCSYMMESIYVEDTPVREFKKQIIEEAKEQGIDCVLELDKMRVRKKKKKGASPGRVYLDHHLIDVRINDPVREIHTCIYVEPLKGPEGKQRYKQRQVYVIRWRPSQRSVDPIEEIILNNERVKHVITKLSELSGVPIEHIYYAKKSKSFPVEISCLDIENKLKWYSIKSDISHSILLRQDGDVIYYKDNREKMKELTDKERSEIKKAEEARLKRIRECKLQY